MDLPNFLETQLDSLRETARTTLGRDFSDETLISRAVQHYRIIFLHMAQRVMQEQPEKRKLALARMIDTELDRLSAVQLEIGSE